MKTAVSSNGIVVAASQAAPTQATCPKCGGVVFLRVRRLMANSGNSYYWQHMDGCLLYTSDAADERSSVELGGRRIIKKKKRTQQQVGEAS